MIKYIWQEHTHCRFDQRLARPYTSFEDVCDILHHTGAYVWVRAHVTDQVPHDVHCVTDRRSEIDDQGCIVVSVPVYYVVQYFTLDEAEAIFSAIDAETRMMQ